MHSKAQVATEFFIYAGIFTILLMATISTTYFTQGSEIAKMEYGLAKQTGQSFADAINLGVKGGQGFTYKFTYSKKILGTPYYVDFSGSSMFITWKGQNENFTYVYNLAKYDYEYDLCRCASGLTPQKLYSDCGDAMITITNSGSKVLIKQECPT